MKTVGIAGYGYVGRAVNSAMKRWHGTVVIDPAFEEFADNKFTGDLDGIVICVSTPQGDDGSCDMTNVIDVINTSPKKVPILIKSTISIDGWTQIISDFPDHYICFSPEFLRAKTAEEDFKNTKEMYISKEKTGSHKHWKELFRNCMPFINVTYFDPEELILGKYFRNSFLATKVIFFNQIYDLCKKKNIDFENVRKIVTDDIRIGDSHSEVTEERGFGGHCFPKDTSAIVETAKNDNVDLTLIEEAIEYNNNVRKKG